MFKAFLSIEGIMLTLKSIGLLFRKKPLDIEDMVEGKDGTTAQRLRDAAFTLEKMVGTKALRASLALSIVFAAAVHGLILYIAVRILWMIVRYFI